MKSFSLYYRFENLSTFKIIATGAKDLMHCLETYGIDNVTVTPLK